MSTEHHGDATLAVPGMREIFGERTALDPEPRSADVSAEEDSRRQKFEARPGWASMRGLGAGRRRGGRGVRRLRSRVLPNRGGDWDPMEGSAPGTFTVRPARPDDDERIAALVRGLSRQTLRLRFMGAMAESAVVAELQREAHAAEPFGESFVAETPDGVLVGHAFAARGPGNEAEVAFVVADPWQHHGVGTALFSALLGRLRAEGVHAVWAETFFDNLPMVKLLRDTGLPAADERHGEMIHVRLDLTSFTAPSTGVLGPDVGCGHEQPTIPPDPRPDRRIALQ